MKIKDLKKGEYFTRKCIENPRDSQVWVRGDYDRSARAYECSRFDDFCHTTMIKGGAEVFTDFTF